MLIIGYVIQACLQNENDIPIILINGHAGDHNSLNELLNNIKQDYPNRRVIAAKILFGTFSSRFMGFSRYIRGVATAIHKAANGAECVDIVGYSQGGLAGRAYTQLYSGFKNNYYPQVRKLISLAGVQGGFYCDVTCVNFTGLTGFFKTTYRIPSVVYSSSVQMRYTPAAFWRDPYHFETYGRICNTLAQINGECVDQTVSTGRERFIRLQKLYTFYSLTDEALLPPSSGNFGTYEPVSGKYIDVKDNTVYKNDNFGLKTLDESGRWVQCRVEVSHGDFAGTAFYKSHVIHALKGDDSQLVCK
ncbi:Palmitoyl-protein_thioesterase [Hexamita inflata]|uniref:Palmitoyl-protein thioesterase n=1 Tax=Hexamita inflata TaxID=28002 RepID=A0AA86Q9W0_9EUKA|nr:Palmitoyl-protein thioesterase [Hexamita inflata]